jgi:replication factor C small subunit
MSKYNSLWVEKYRPSTLDDILLTDEVKTFFKSLVDEIPHVFLWGKPGTGKTTLAKIVVNDILKCQYLYINASDENGVDTVRNKIISFAQTKSFDGKMKIIILDEADGLTKEGQRILRNVMEEYSDNVRFILTANYYNEIIEPLESRCIIFNLKPTLQQAVERCLLVLSKENIQLPSDISDKLKTFIEKREFDLRRCINDLQKFSINGVFTVETTSNSLLQAAQKITKSLLMKESVLDIRKYVILNENAFESDYQSLMKEIFSLVFNSKLEDKQKKSILLELGEYMYRDNSVLDHEINFFCCLMSIEKILS